MIPPLPRLQSADPTFNRFQDYLRQTLAQLTRNEPWNAPDLVNGWVNLDPSNNSIAGYMKDALGFIRLRGTVKGGTVGASTPVFTLPVGYRPARGANFPVVSNAAFGYVFVNPNGNVEVVAGNNAYVDLDGINFDTR